MDAYYSIFDLAIATYWSYKYPRALAQGFFSHITHSHGHYLT